MAEGIKVSGLNAAVKALRTIGVPSSTIGEASQRAGDIVAQEGRSLVPVRSGDLRETIKARKVARKVVVSAGNNSRVPYANPIHFGWTYDKNNFVKKNIRPNPFFTVAIRRKRKEVYEAFFGSLEKLLKEQSTKP
jgi:hypothetical protein